MKAYAELNETELTFGQAVAAYEEAKAKRDDLIRQITTAGFADLITVQQKTGDQMIAALQVAAITAQQARTSAAEATAAAQAAQAAAEAQRAANDNLPWLNWMNGMPGFASGGSHRGGWRIVGEDGPEVEYTGPSRIMNGDQIASALAGGASADEIGKAVAAELAEYLYPIAKTNQQISDRLKRWDGDGMPEERSAA
jgi:multidrug efflux pump subunit AcrA (membrane-fusion protein)